MPLFALPNHKKKERKSRQVLSLFALPHILSISFPSKKKLHGENMQKNIRGILKPPILVGDLKEDSGVIRNLEINVLNEVHEEVLATSHDIYNIFRGPSLSSNCKEVFQ